MRRATEQRRKSRAARPGATGLAVAVSLTAMTLATSAPPNGLPTELAAVRRARPARRAAPAGARRADARERATAALAASVPRDWAQAVPVHIEIVPGNTSLSSPGGLIRLGRGQMEGSWDHARFIASHEWGHQLAFRYGDQAFAGAPPAGFPYGGVHPEEVWADCVARTLTGVSWPTYGQYPVCDAGLAGWAGRWLAPGPSARAARGN